MGRRNSPWGAWKWVPDLVTQTLEEWDTETPLPGHQCETTHTDMAYQDRFGQSR